MRPERKRYSFPHTVESLREAAENARREAQKTLSRIVTPKELKSLTESNKQQIKSKKSPPYNVRNCSLYPQQTIFVLGGGTSLKDFDFELLRNKFVIGCNDAYKLGNDIVDVLYFGDRGWWKVHNARVREAYTNPIYSRMTFTGVRYMAPSKPELSDNPSELCWHRNSGCAALNLALLYGAKSIILLGYDMKLGSNGDPNWHVNEVSQVKGHVYKAYMNGFDKIAPFIPLKFGNVRVINANPDSAMNTFPKMDREQALRDF